MATSLLLADDSPTIAKILGMALQNDDYKVRSVLTAAEAVNELSANPPQLFLVDLTLPERNGYDFTRLVKSDKKLKGVKVILLASAFEPADPALVEACGADAVIAKPFDPSELRAALSRTLMNPVKFPAGSQVSGAMGGVAVTASVAGASASSSEEPPPFSLSGNSEKGEVTRILMGEAPSTGDADSILGGLLSGNPEPSKLINVSESPAQPPEFSSSDYTPARATESPSKLDIPPPTPSLAPAAPVAAAPILAPATAELDLASSLLSGDSGAFDPASALLAGLGGESLENPPAFSLSATEEPLAPPSHPPAVSPPTAPAEVTGLTMSTVQLDTGSQLLQTGSVTNTNTDEQVLDFSAAFEAGHEGSTAMIDMSALGSGFIQKPTNPSIKTAPPPMAAAANATKEEPALSSNAQALAAFFEAEIDSQPPASPAPSMAPSQSPAPFAPSPLSPPPAMGGSALPTMSADDSFDDSLSSIDWGETPDSSSLNSWSSQAPSPAANAKPAPLAARTEKTNPRFEPSAREPAPAPARAEMPAMSSTTLRTNPSGASAAGSFMFDTGGSTFRFSPDYVQRITKSYTGSPEEMILGKDPSTPKTQMFPQESNDTGFPSASSAAGGPMAAPGLAPMTGGTWSPEDRKQMENIIRQEVQMAVREVLEKVVWEVVPELAENLIRKELEKALKEAEEE